LQEHFTGFLDIGTIPYTYKHINTAFFFPAVVDNTIAKKLGVRDYCLLIIGFVEGCSKETNIFHGSFFAITFDYIAYAERFENEYHYPAGKVRQRPL